MNKRRGQRERLKQETIKKYVLEKLKLRWSPEQISGRILKDKKLRISHEAIYQFIYAQYHRGGNGRCTGINLVKYLRHKHKRRARKYVPFFDIPLNEHGKVYIHDRPAYIEKRKQYGHWETDSMVSRQSDACLNTSVERVSGYVHIQKLKDHTSRATTNAIMRFFSPLPEKFGKASLRTTEQNSADRKKSPPCLIEDISSAIRTLLTREARTKIPTDSSAISFQRKRTLLQ